MKTSKKDFGIYLVITFAVAWALQILASTVLKNYFQIIIAISMFAPLLAVLITKRGLSKEKTNISWQLGFKKNWKMILVAWLTPAVITLLGAVLYFVIFPNTYDSSFGYLVNNYQASGVALANGTIAGIPLSTMVLISSIQAITYAPLLNCFFAVGEEAGWRGFMIPALNQWFGKRTALIIGGIIWGLWHAPLIIFAGYEYGTDYFGAPITGVLLFCVITTAMGIILSWIYTKTDSIWIPAIFHGAFNAAATIPMCFTDGTMTGHLLGPIPNGLIAGIPIIILALIIFIRMGKKLEA